MIPAHGSALVNSRRGSSDAVVYSAFPIDGAALADLKGADLRSADLTNANLTGANLKNAKLNNVSAENSNFYGASLTKAVLSNGNFSNAGFYGADFTNANPAGRVHRPRAVARFGRADLVRPQRRPLRPRRPRHLRRRRRHPPPRPAAADDFGPCRAQRICRRGV